MFERFLSKYPVESRGTGARWDVPELRSIAGYDELWSQVGDAPLCDGLLRLVDAESGRNASSFVREGFPELSTRAVPFAVDWIGRVVAIDLGRPPGLLLIEPGSGQAFEIDESFHDYFDIDLVDDPMTLLESNLFGAWRNAGGLIPTNGQCVGFKVPLFLGGRGDVPNMEVTDLAVYWDVSAQLWAQARTLTPGTKISQVTDG